MKLSLVQGLLCGCSFLTAIPLAALADTVGGDSSGSAPAVGIETVVVTANKHEEHSQDVPISLTALSPEQLDSLGVTSVQDLTRVTPGLIYTTTGPNAMPVIRGVATRSFSPGDSAPVALYVDNVYLPAEGAGEFEFGDIERIEVLKGPQGTLFGRNATGGAINVITRDPTSAAEYRMEVGYGSFNEMEANGFANGELFNGVNGSLSAFVDKDDGYTKNLITGKYVPSKNDWGVRGKLAFQPLDNLSFILEADTVKTDSPGSYMNELYSGTNRNVVAHPATTFTTSLFGQAYSNINTTAFGPGPKAQNIQSGVTLTGNLDLGGASVKSITAVRDVITTGLLDTDGTNLAITSQYLRTTNLTYTQEFVATSTGDGPLTWTAGLFFMADDAARNPNYSYTSATTFTTIFASMKTIAGAPYGEVTYKFDDHWALTGGFRYSYETKHLLNFSGTNCLTMACTRPRVNNSKTWQAVNYRATLQYIVDPTLNFYITNSTGFKSGAYNSTAFDGTPVLPENLIAYEAGVKSTRYGVVFTGDVFYYVDKGIQVSASVNPLTGSALLQNAAGAHDYGMELTAATSFDDNWSGEAGLTYLHARYTSFPSADVLIPRATALGGGNIETAENDTGNPVFRSPDWTFNISGKYTHPLFDGRFDANAGFYFSSQFSFEPGNRVVQPAYSTLHLQASWTSPNNLYTATIWGDNVTNTHYYDIGSSSIIWYNDVWAAPARFGVKLALHTD